MMDANATPQPTPAGATEPLVRGAKLGRYVILERLGEGGMGVVYAAYDPVLDRRVALKLLRQGEEASSPSGDVGKGQARLLREAQAMARLSHPHVLAVHDVGLWHEQVFLAMELVDGETLGRWLRGDPSISEVLAVFHKAGQGLAAAHAAGLVHRDFKPDNVLLGRDGRVRVADFGLARSTGGAAEAPAVVSAEALPSLTQTGALVGTPAYMAPEQYLGWPADARTDQFSFCAALYEALYRQLPFAGDSAAALAAAVVAGHLREAPAESPVSPALRRVITRGLQVQASQRYPSMDALLQALQAAQVPPARRLRAWALGLGLLALGLGLGARSLRSRAEVCGGAAEQLAGLWDDGRAQALARAFQAAGRPADEFPRVDQRLRGYRAAWAAMHREACEATQVRRVQSAELMDLRMGCLDQSQREARALIEVLLEDPAALPRAAEATRGLTELARCADGGALRADRPGPEPQAPELRRQLAASRLALARGRALRETGRYARGLSAAGEATAAARSAGFPPALAEGLYLLGDVRSESGDVVGAEDALREALDAALSAHQQRTAARAAARLVYVIGAQAARPREGHQWTRTAEALLTALGGDAEVRGWLLAGDAAVLIAEGRYRDAEARMQEALTLRRRALGPEHPAVAGSLLTLANTLYYQGRYAEAIQRYQAAQALWEQQHGPDHPYVGICLDNRAASLQESGHLSEALEPQRRALAINERAFGPRHPVTGNTVLNLGRLLTRLGRVDEGLALLQRALTIHEQAHPRKPAQPLHPDLAGALQALGEGRLRAGRPAEALPLLAEARAAQEAQGAEHPELATTLRLQAEALLATGQGAQALPLAQRALAIAERRLGAQHPITGQARATLERARR